ncbi:hypothetical protein [Actinoplanes solisilvae]|uniref:hypothetical protein n=1 Tax=Actinoplanes solisilvae TaxID=2486853 RepID=UPI000FDC349E|nr:hypothetical protein [Actinoplanes solisilvae]
MRLSERTGTFTVRFKFWILAGWLGVFAVAVIASGPLFDRMSTVDNLDAGAESARVQARIEELTDGMLAKNRPNSWHGEVAWGPSFTATSAEEDDYVVTEPDDLAINALLRWLGVRRDGHLDEFDTAGLDRHSR